MLLSHDLKAFIEVARRGSFVLASKALHVTQSAVSQRIANLEERLEARLFVRGRGRVSLTPEGESLLRYAVSGEALELELLSSLGLGTQGAKGVHDGKGPVPIGGTLRIGAFSSVSRSLVLPALAPFLQAHPRVRLDLRTREVWELERLLTSREVDLLVTAVVPIREGVASVRLGTEYNVLVENPSAPASTRSALLDHDEHDEVSEAFVRLQKKAMDQKPDDDRAALEGASRHFVDDVDGILSGVEAGIARAVVPRHLMAGTSKLREVAGYRALETPVFLCWHDTPEPSRLVRAACGVLEKEIAPLLARGNARTRDQLGDPVVTAAKPTAPERTRRAKDSNAAKPRSKVSGRTAKTNRQ